MKYHRLKTASFAKARVLVVAGVTRIAGIGSRNLNHRPGEDPFQTIHCDWGTCDLSPVLLRGHAESVTVILEPKTGDPSPVFCFA
jgi:hypothetical protein